MAQNNYYDESSRQQQPQQPYYQPYNQQQPPLSRLPSYRSQAPLTAGRPPTEPSPVSPFEAPFDDHVYPMRPMDSQTTLGADSYRYGQGGGGRPGLNGSGENSFRDDIPLRDHPGQPGKNDNAGEGDGVTDHVYDAPAGLEGGRGPGYGGATNRGGNGRGGDAWIMPLDGGDGKGGKKKRIPWVVYTLTAIQVAVFIAEIVKNAILTKSPIEIHPSFNPMIGPSPWVLINMGARYVPCMHNVVGIQNSTEIIQWGCPNTTDNSQALCTLGQLCGFSGFQNPFPEPFYNASATIHQSPEPNQWFRFIIPMFLHAGIIHIGFNMLLQMTLGREMEIAIGPIRFFLVYICSGIFGFVLGGNFAAPGIASTGASGALFGIIALTLLDLLYTWRERRSPWKDLAFIMLDVVISFVLGLLPGLDNFSHIGGFLMGLVLGVCILHSPNALRTRINQDPPYEPVMKSDGDRPDSGITGFFKNPLHFFQGRRGAWWAWWIARALSLVAVFVVFIILLNNFYVYRKTCSWCKYLSCINVNNWCDIGNIQLTNLNTTSGSNTTSKRSVFDSWDQMAQLYGE